MMAAIPILTILLREQAKMLIIPLSLSRGLDYFLGVAARQIAGCAAEARVTAETTQPQHHADNYGKDTVFENNH